MKQRAVIVVFFLIAIGLVVFFMLNGSPSEQKVSQPRSKIVNPVQLEKHEFALSDDVLEQEAEMTSFIPLSPDETLVDILTIDFDGDTRDDQINLVRKVTNPYLYLIVGLYDSVTGSYERTAEIQTPITQAHSFSYAGLDVLGNHQMELVYQGVTDDGYSILRVYKMEKDYYGSPVFEIIGDFVSDGSIFVQQVQRDQSYELSHINAEPFDIVCYGSAELGAKSYEQFQITYKWNVSEKRFVESSREKMSERRVMANELAKIQDGTVKTFVKFLDGLWYKTSNDGAGIRYLSFDYENSEVILQYEDFEEVYLWLDSYLTNAGIYLSTKNTSISSLNRRYYITLVSSSEIRLRIQENIGMIINESNLWDGNYKKMTSRTGFSSPESKISSADFLKDLTSAEFWEASDGSKLKFAGGKYKISTEFSQETGKFSVMDVGSVPVIAFKPDSSVEKPMLKRTYQLSYGMKVSKNSKKTKTKVVPAADHGTVIIQPVNISLQMPEAADGTVLTLKKH